MAAQVGLEIDAVRMEIHNSTFLHNPQFARVATLSQWSVLWKVGMKEALGVIKDA